MLLYRGCGLPEDGSHFIITLDSSLTASGKQPDGARGGRRTTAQPCAHPSDLEKNNRTGEMKRVIIDCDPGVDDAAALLFALASPELNVEAVTTVFGNGPVDVCTANALRILAAAGREDIPVYRGAGRPLLRQTNPGWASQVHGTDALGNLPPETAGRELGEAAREPAAVEIVRRVMEAPRSPQGALDKLPKLATEGGTLRTR